LVSVDGGSRGIETGNDGTIRDVPCGSGNMNDHDPSVNHLCIETEGRDSLIEKALSLGFRVYTRERKGKPNLVFIYDHDGNPYEIIQ